MKKSIHILIGLLIGTLIISCDKVNEPYLEYLGTTYDTLSGNDTLPMQMVLIEDFTGHKCVNCPEAAVLAQNIQLASNNRVIIMSIHAGYFAVPDQTGNYTADFRCSESESLYTHFGISSNPTGLINRTTYLGKRVLKPDVWQNAVNTQLSQSPRFDIRINNTYNTANRQLSSVVKVKSLTDNAGEYKLCLYIVENNIIAPQKNNIPAIGTTPDILNYVHKHILRGSLNGTWGESIYTENPVIQGDVFEKTISYTVSENWVADNCSIIAFVYRNDEGTEKEAIIQVAEKHLK
ncbi:MAG: Omp28 family outer membrane lipoprotein [Bacteroidales bacterium]|jgi:hypothetical protein|nr:Omp28 family outer membrane lipoprotein [Bacteroidales bacterium]